MNPEDGDPHDSRVFDHISEMIEESGFTILPVDAIMNLLAQMELYVSEQAGVPVEDIDGYINQIEELVGSEEAMYMDLDEIVAWVRVFKQQR